MRNNGYIAFVLHAHLPFVKHPTHDRFLEERWFFEAVVETYVPLLMGLMELVHKNVSFGITISISPTLMAMFADPLLKKKCREHILGLIELAEREISRTRNNPQEHELALMYQGRFSSALGFWDAYQGDLLSAFRDVAASGKVELIVTAATHAYLPMYAMYPEAVKAQVRCAKENNIRDFFQVCLKEYGFRNVHIIQDVSTYWMSLALNISSWIHMD